MKKENKKQLYLALWIMTGILLGVLFGSLIELAYLYNGAIEIAPRLATYGFTVLAGVIFGVWIGPLAWEKVYVDGARDKKYTK